MKGHRYLRPSGHAGLGLHVGVQDHLSDGVAILGSRERVRSDDRRRRGLGGPGPGHPRRELGGRGAGRRRRVRSAGRRWRAGEWRSARLHGQARRHRHEDRYRAHRDTAGVQVERCGRHDTVTSTTLQQVGNTRIEQTDRAFTDRTGLLHAFEAGIGPYVSYFTLSQPAVHTSYNGIVPPTALGAGSTPFRPTTGQQIEGGVKDQPPGTASLFTLAGFSIDQQNVLVPATSGFQAQVGGVRAEGFEAEAKVTAFERFDSAVAYSYLDARITRTGTGPTAPRIGARIPVTPYNQAALFATYSVPAGPLLGLTVVGGVRVFGDHFGDLVSTIRILSDTLFDAALRYDLARLDPAWAGATLTINATNLFDKVYVGTCDTLGSCYYGTPRTVLASLSDRW